MTPTPSTLKALYFVRSKLLLTLFYIVLKTVVKPHLLILTSLGRFFFSGKYKKIFDRSRFFRWNVSIIIITTMILETILRIILGNQITLVHSAFA